MKPKALSRPCVMAIVGILRIKILATMLYAYRQASTIAAQLESEAINSRTRALREVMAGNTLLSVSTASITSPVESSKVPIRPSHGENVMPAAISGMAATTETTIAEYVCEGGLGALARVTA